MDKTSKENKAELMADLSELDYVTFGLKESAERYVPLNEVTKLINKYWPKEVKE